MANRNIQASTEKPRFFHAPSSYYSMIARLALAECGIDYKPVFVDIHVRMTQQSPDYARLNSNMSVPTLVMPGRNLEDSLPIADRLRPLEVGLNQQAAHCHPEPTYDRDVQRHSTRGWSWQPGNGAPVRQHRDSHAGPARVGDLKALESPPC